MTGYEIIRLNRWDADWFYHRRVEAQAVHEKRRPVALEKIASRDNLYHCYQRSKREGGPGPGLSGIGYDDVSPVEAGELAGQLSQMIREGRYRPCGIRAASIRKPSGGQRDLSLGEITDRTVAKALLYALEPLAETVFLDNSWGFRPQRGPWAMIADLTERMQADNCWIVAVEDVSGAFDNLRTDDVLNAHRRLFEETSVQELLPPQRGERERILDLVARVVQGSDPSRCLGIDQGSPYSPLALNVHLHYAHDVQLAAQQMGPRWWRYADDLTYAGQNMAECRQTRELAQSLLTAAGLEFKTAKGGVYDLKRGDELELLGFTLRKRKWLQIDLSAKALENLRLGLEACHEASNPPQAAASMLHGWIQSAGPAFRMASSRVEQILQLAAEVGFREIGSPRALRERWEEAWRVWQRLADKRAHDAPRLVP